MSKTSLIRRLNKRLSAFRAARGGNVVITFALLLVPIMGLVGAAVDYSRANSDKAAMQAAVDSTALMLSKELATLNSSQMSQKANDYFYALFTRTGVTGIAITPTLTTSGGSQLVVTGTGAVPTTIMKIMGFSSLTINVSSTVRWGNTRVRLALVLDNTGSMSSANKMTALKTAAKNLLTQLRNAASQNGDVYVSIVPFAKDVNVDPVNYSQPWIKWSGSSTQDTWDENNGSCSRSSYSSNKANCQSQQWDLDTR